MEPQIFKSYIFQKKIFDEYIRLQSSNGALLSRIQLIYTHHISKLEESGYEELYANLTKSRELNFKETLDNCNNCLQDLDDKYKLIKFDNERLLKKLNELPTKSSHEKNLQKCNIKKTLKKSDHDIHRYRSTYIIYLEEQFLNLKKQKEDLLIDKNEYFSNDHKINIQADIEQHIQIKLNNEDVIKNLTEKIHLLQIFLRASKIHSKIEDCSISLEDCIYKEASKYLKNNELESELDELLSILKFEKTYLDEYSSHIFVDLCFKESKYNVLIDILQTNKLCCTRTLIDIIYNYVTTANNILNKNTMTSLLKICQEFYSSNGDYLMYIVCLIGLNKFKLAAKIVLDKSYDLNDILNIIQFLKDEHSVKNFILMTCGLLDQHFALKANLFLDIIKGMFSKDAASACKMLFDIKNYIEDGKLCQVIMLSNIKEWILISEYCQKNNYNLLASYIITCVVLYNTSKKYKNIRNKH